jgi:hypothetical protein
MRVAVVTEGAADSAIIGRVFAASFRDEHSADVSPRRSGSVEIVPAGGASAAESLARSIVVSRPNPVALAIDADEIDTARIAERQRFLESSLAMYGSRRPTLVVLFVPTIEATLCRQPAALTGVALSEIERERAKFDPRDVLHEVAHRVGIYHLRLRDLDAWEPVLQPRWDVVADEPEFRKLTSFVHRAGRGL